MRNLDLDSLHIFKAVVDFGGITNAAAQLSRVQSNITTRVKNLELRLGVELFRRQAGRLTPTREGEVLYSYAEKLLKLAAEAELALQRGAPRGSLRIGTLESTAAARLPPLLSTYHEHYPDIQIELSSGSSDTLISRVHKGEIEGAFVSEPFNMAGFQTQEAFVEELILITAKNTTIRNSRELAGQTIIAFAEGCSYRRILEKWLNECNVIPVRVLELASYHAITACVAAGTGIAIMPRSVLRAVNADALVRVLALPAKMSATRTHLIWREGESSEALSALIKEIRRTGS